MEKRKRGRPKKEISENSITSKIDSSEGIYTATEYIFGREEGLTNQEPRIGKFSTLKDLLNLSWIKPFSRMKDHKFMISKKADFNFLIVEIQHGTVWYILAIIPKDFDNDLPNFRVRNGVGVL